MIDLIKNFLQNIVDLFVSAWDFLVSVFEDIAFLIKTVFGFFEQIPDYLGFVPAPVLAVLIVGFSGAIIYKILGRD